MRWTSWFWYVVIPGIAGAAIGLGAGRSSARTEVDVQPPAWASRACEARCFDFGMAPVLMPSTAPEDQGWHCLCDPTIGC